MPAELGPRLRELRHRAGLRQSDVARLVSGRWDQTMVSRLETGDMENPTLGLVADYLRVCRAGFEDITDILKQYTSKPLPVEDRGRREVERAVRNLPDRLAMPASRYDAKTSVDRRLRRSLPLTPQERVKRAMGLALAAARAERLKTLLDGMMGALDTPATMVGRRNVTLFGQKVWGMLRRTRLSSPSKRLRRLACIIGDAVAGHSLTVEDAHAIVDAVVELFYRMEKSGEFGPPAAPAPRVRRPRPKDPELAAREAAMTTREAFIEEAHGRAYIIVEREMSEEKARWRYSHWLRDLCSDAYETLPGSPEREALIEKALEQREDKEKARYLVGLMFAKLDYLLKRQPSAGS
jgi:transcriptional regulator with XRE-family HTH domain